MLVVAVIHEDIYNQIPEEYKYWFKSVKFVEENEYESHREDPLYRKLFKDKMDTQKKLEKYLFNKRHKDK